MSSFVMLPDFSLASHFLQSMPDLASKEQIGVFNYYKLKMMCLLGYITHMRSGRTPSSSTYPEPLQKTAVEEEIKDRIAQSEVQGRDVEYWKVLDRIKIVRI